MRVVHRPQTAPNLAIRKMSSAAPPLGSAMYHKNPEFACAECHKSFKNQRALDAHNKALHQDPEVVRPVRDRHLSVGQPSGRLSLVRDGDEGD